VVSRSTITTVRWVVPSLLAACHTSGGPPPKAPNNKPVVTEPAPVVETEADREAKRLAAVHAIVPPGTTCLPAALNSKFGPRLELAAVENDAILCAHDTTRDRLLGPVACWKIDLGSGGLTYREPAPLPGIGFMARIEERCVRGFCLPKDDDVPADKVAHLSYSLDGSKVAMLTGEQIALFDSTTREREGGFTIKGIGKVAALHSLGDTLFVEAGDAKKRGVYMFKTDGTRLGAIDGPDGALDVINGSFSLLDQSRVAIAEQGFTALTVLDIETGKKTRIARALPKSPCSADETAAYWAGGDDVPDKCSKHMVKTFDHLVGATAVAGARNLLVVLRNGRLGDLAVLDAANLAEKKSIALEWCEEPSE
jgi:hypothetical protein